MVWGASGEVDHRRQVLREWEGAPVCPCVEAFEGTGALSNYWQKSTNETEA